MTNNMVNSLFYYGVDKQKPSWSNKMTFRDKLNLIREEYKNRQILDFIDIKIIIDADRWDTRDFIRTCIKRNYLKRIEYGEFIAGEDLW